MYVHQSLHAACRLQEIGELPRYLGPGLEVVDLKGDTMDHLYDEWLQLSVANHRITAR